MAAHYDPYPFSQFTLDVYPVTLSREDGTTIKRVKAVFSSGEFEPRTIVAADNVDKRDPDELYDAFVQCFIDGFSEFVRKRLTREDFKKALGK